jgi:hypothetical protein
MTDDELVAVWAAMCSMVEDVHCPQDNLTREQWDAAETLLERMTGMVESKERNERGAEVK